MPRAPGVLVSFLLGVVALTVTAMGYDYATGSDNPSSVACGSGNTGYQGATTGDITYDWEPCTHCASYTGARVSGHYSCTGCAEGQVHFLTNTVGFARFLTVTQIAHIFSQHPACRATTQVPAENSSQRPKHHAPTTPSIPSASAPLWTLTPPRSSRSVPRWFAARHRCTAIKHGIAMEGQRLGIPSAQATR